ncbi:endo-1,4-beta-xylanase [Sphingobacterium griseoflavum]|nr:endo-1,4-beta-xylanase [Sphingobacterium griseoflavum]
MNKICKIRLAIGIAASIALGSCAKFENRNFETEKPQQVIDQEALDAYAPLKTYVNYSEQAHFKLGVEMNWTDLRSNSTLYRLMQAHVDEISLTSELLHIKAVGEDGQINISDLQDALEKHAASGMATHLGHLLWHEAQAANYLNNLVADVNIPGESGTILLQNFEDDALDQSYPVIGAGSTRVKSDPDGVSGKALNVLGPQTFPQFEISLPDDLKLGDCKSITIDFKGAGCCGLYGAGMRMAVSNSLGAVSLVNYGSPSSYGAPDNQWFRNGIDLTFANLNLSSAQKQLTNFVLTIGSATGGADYLIDNITLHWEKTGQTIIKTADEKREIFTAELDKWIKTIAEAGKESVKSWSVVYQPIDEESPSEIRSGGERADLPANMFFWQDFLGKDYASIAVKMIKQYANADDQIFFTENNLIDNPAKIEGLIDLIAYTESKGASVDGIVAEMSMNVGDSKEKIVFTLQKLAETNKLVKVSFDIGTGTSINQMTNILHQQQKEMHRWFVEAYHDIIPKAQRGGMTFRSPVDRLSGSTWRPNQPVGLWTNSGGYQRKPAYLGVIEGLQQ